MFSFDQSKHRLSDLSTRIQLDDSSVNDYSMLMKDVNHLRRYVDQVQKDEYDSRVKEVNMRLDASDYRLDEKQKQRVVEDFVASRLSVEAKKLKLVREVQEAETKKALLDRGILPNSYSQTPLQRDSLDLEQLRFSK